MEREVTATENDGACAACAANAIGGKEQRGSLWGAAYDG
jgi:hypothetical protein